MLSKTAEYALRAVLWLAANPDGTQTTEQMADGTRVSASYLAKVLQMLGRAKLVTSQPGPRGGFELVAAPDTLSVLDVVNAVDPLERITTCPLKLMPHRVRLCPLHARLDAIAAFAEKTLRSCAISDLLDEAPDRVPLCVPRRLES
jgi:Rrf2 family protein